MFDGLWTHLLKRIEAFPDATFRESELAGISKRQFDQMVKDGFIEFDHYDKEGDLYFSDRIGDQGVERTIRVRNNKITAFSVESDVAMIELTKLEITYYRFNFDKLFQCLHKENNLSGSLSRISERIVYIGHFDSLGKKISVLLGTRSNEFSYLMSAFVCKKPDNCFWCAKLIATEVGEYPFVSCISLIFQILISINIFGLPISRPHSATKRIYHACGHEEHNSY